EFQNIKSNHVDEIKEIKRNFQKLFNEMLVKLNEEKDKIDTLEVKN
uniref:Plasmid recombination enzyme n=1 Tax=Meloidogyne hapla TaxID=6305 RepID=A0A1I8BHE0_MELHA